MSDTPRTQTPLELDRQKFVAVKGDDVEQRVARTWLAAMASHERRLIAYLRHVTREPTELNDLLGDTWTTAWCEREADSEHPPNERELVHHARNAAARWMAADRREIAFDETLYNAIVVLEDDDSGGDQHTSALRILKLMPELPTQQFRAVVCRCLRGVSFEVTARMMDCSMSAAKTHYGRGIKALRRRCEEDRLRETGVV